MPTRPALMPGRPASAPPWAAARPPRAPRWGWLEWTIVAQTAFPALLFVPGIAPLRTLTRVASFVIALMAWAAVAAAGRRSPGRPFPAAAWLVAAAAWLGVMVLHPTTNSLLAGLGQAGLNIAILSPAIWGGAALRSSRQLRRLMALLFLCNAASAVVGIGQFYRPDLFNPPVIPILQMREDVKTSLEVEAADGRRVLRPCGLSDTPGMASLGGSISCLIGLCWALRPMPAWRRAACVGLAMAGMGVIYLSQVRSSMLTLALCVVALAVLMAWRGDFRGAARLGVITGVSLLGAVTWAARSGGKAMIERFTSMLGRNPTELFAQNRGYFLQDLLERLMWDYPAGAGLGRWGQIYAAFGDKTPTADRGSLYAEIQWTGWLFDGGIPLMALYAAAMAVALADAIRIARTSPDEEVGFWAGAVGAWGLGVVAASFGSCPFISPTGVQFWAMFAAVHAADARARLERLAARAAPA